LAAIELKSQIGPSFVNNCNNRAEEAIGSAVDLWTAYREGAFNASPQPWLGYLFLLEDCPKSKTPVRVFEPHFVVLPEFENSSYAKRYELLCSKLVRERHNSSACFFMANKEQTAQICNYTESSGDPSANQFLTQLFNHLNIK
jgi:hypothetical protein